MTIFDRRQIRRAFGRAANSYSQAAALQREIESRLLEQLAYLDDKKPQRIVDLGCGPGQASGWLKKRWPRAHVIALDSAMPMLAAAKQYSRWWRPLHRLCADARALPLADQSIDLVFSNLCLQWVDDLPAVLNELRRVMRPQALLVFTSFGPDTLQELRAAYQQASHDPPVSPFAPIQAIGDALLQTGFRNPVLDRDYITLTYTDAAAMIRELKAIGATDARQQRPRGLAGRKRLSEIQRAYRVDNDGRVQSTWEVITAMAWAPDPAQPRRQASADIVSVPLAQIPIRRKRS